MTTRVVIVMIRCLDDDHDHDSVNDDDDDVANNMMYDLRDFGHIKHHLLD